jgi:hypothetical protein
LRDRAGRQRRRRETSCRLLVRTGGKRLRVLLSAQGLLRAMGIPNHLLLDDAILLWVLWRQLLLLLLRRGVLVLGLVQWGLLLRSCGRLGLLSPDGLLDLGAGGLLRVLRGLLRIWHGLLLVLNRWRLLILGRLLVLLRLRGLTVSSRLGGRSGVRCCLGLVGLLSLWVRVGVFPLVIIHCNEETTEISVETPLSATKKQRF